MKPVKPYGWHFISTVSRTRRQEAREWLLPLACFVLTGMLVMVKGQQTYAHEIPPAFEKVGELLAMPATNSWADFRSNFMSRWGRKPGQERWQMEEVHLEPETHKQVMETLHHLGLTNAWLPQNKTYDYAILPGATFPSMKTRLDWLAEQWQRGVRFQQLVVLAGQRPLTPEVDRFQEIMSSLSSTESGAKRKTFPMNDKTAPMHETEAARLLLHYYPLPEGMEQVPVQIIDSPRKWQGDSWGRSHTADTVRDWLAYSPKPGTALVISNQPSAHYQDAVFRRHLPSTFSIETSTAEIGKNYSMAIILDGVATWLRICEQPPIINNL